MRNIQIDSYIFVFLNLGMPISNIHYYISIFPAPHKYMHTQKIACMVAEKKKILPCDFTYILNKHHLILTGCNFIADLFFNNFIFFCCSHSKNFGEFSSKPTGYFSKTFPRIF